jgi:hypothetical protein
MALERKHLMQALKGEVDRRAFLKLAGIGLGAAAFGATTTTLPGEEIERPNAASPDEPVLRIEPDSKRASIGVLSWDTEGGNKAQTNLLRVNSPIVLRVRAGGMWIASRELEARREDFGDGGTSYAFTVSTDAELHWTIRPSSSRLVMSVSGRGQGIRDVEAVEMVFPFDPQVTPTTILPQIWCEDGCGKLPAVISCPDFGQILLDDQTHPGIKARLEGNRDKHTVDLILELHGIVTGATYTLTFTPVRLAPPEGMSNNNLWQEVRRGWFTPTTSSATL